MAKIDEERAYIKALSQAHLTEDEIKALKKLTAVDLLDMGTLAEAVVVKQWCKSESYRLRAKAASDGDEFQGYPIPPTRTYPFYEP